MGTLKTYATTGHIHAEGRYDPDLMCRYSIRVVKAPPTKKHSGYGTKVGIPRIPSFPTIAIARFIEDHLSGTVLEVAAKDPRGVGLYSYTLYFDRQTDYRLFLVMNDKPSEWDNFKIYLREVEDRIQSQEITCPHCKLKI